MGIVAGITQSVASVVRGILQKEDKYNPLQVSRAPVTIKDGSFFQPGEFPVRCANNLCANHKNGLCLMTNGKCEFVKVQK